MFKNQRVINILKLLALFIAILLTDLLVIVKIGTEFGAWVVIAFIVIPGFIGAAMARSHGLSVLRKIKGELGRGRIPGGQLLDGVLIFCGGILLVIPGIFSGILGITVLIPQMRKLYRDMLVYRLLRKIAGIRILL